jgi:hypothetical protein
MLGKEKQSGGTLDLPPNIQTTNLVEPFWLSAGIQIPINTLFILCSKNSSNLTCSIKLRVPRVDNINGQSTVPPLGSSFMPGHLQNTEIFTIKF